MRGQILIVILTLASVLSGCGGGTPGQPVPQPGNTTGFLTDSPADGVLALRADITAATFGDSAGHNLPVAGLPRRVELKHLELAPGLMFQTFLPPVSYTSFSVTVANVELDMASQGGGAKTFTSSSHPALVVPNFTVTVPVNLTVQPDAKVGVMIDFDLAKSLVNDVSGDYTFNPAVHIKQVEAVDPGWELGAARGRVIVISNSPPSLTLQLFDSGITVSLAVDSNTYFSPDLQSIAGLKVGQAVETYARFENGTYIADFIDSAADPTVSKQGFVLGTPTVGGTPLSILIQN